MYSQLSSVPLASLKPNQADREYGIFLRSHRSRSTDGFYGPQLIEAHADAEINVGIKHCIALRT